MDIVTLGLGAAFLVLLLWGLAVVVGHFRPNRVPIRLPRMAERLGLSLRRIGESELATHLPTAARLCRKCRSQQECEAWLAGTAGAADPPEFCVNRNYLRLAREAGDVPH